MALRRVSAWTAVSTHQTVGPVRHWVEIAIDRYLALPDEQQRLVDSRIEKLHGPAGPGTSYDPQTDLWTTTDSAGAGLITYIYRTDRPRLVILRLFY